MSEQDEREPEWPEPRDDPDEEPSHPGARLEELTDTERKRISDDADAADA